MPYPEQAEDMPAPPKLDHWNGRASRPIRYWVILAIILGISVIVGLALYGAPNWLKSNPALNLSMAELRSNNQVISALGKPIERGWGMSGQFKFNEPDSFANMFIPVSGPKGRGMVISRSVKVSGKWVLVLLILRIHGNPAPIVLINTENLQIPNAGQADLPIILL
ncbi:MAG: hypothetical protein JKX91_10450 [Rhizobiaceae bacterium]|nr:hypothetical protein [Rhizobiaceae bacterium]